MITNRTPVTLLTGFGAQLDRGAELLGPGTVLVHHDLSQLGEGVVVRTLRTETATTVNALELAHGCVSCTLREDLLPLLRKLHRRSDVRRIVLQLDPMLEVGVITYAIENLAIVDVVGQVDGPAGRDVLIDQVMAFIDGETWLDHATGDTELAEFLPGARPDDERTVAQVAVGQVMVADAIVVAGDPGHPHAQLELDAVLRRLAPGAGVFAAAVPLPQVRLRGRSGHRVRIDDPHGSLLPGCPPLGAELGVQWLIHEANVPLHPGRLHEALDVLLDEVVTARGRVWIAAQHDAVLWLESAGGGLRVAEIGPWIAAMDPEQRVATAANADDRLAFAALRWNEVYGDRHTSLAILVRDADPEQIHRALRWAELTPAEIEAGPDRWRHWDDPFGEWHADPCEPEPPADSTSSLGSTSRNRPDSGTNNNFEGENE